MIIGFSGKIGTGKTALATALEQKCRASGIGAIRMAFGDLLKEEVARGVGIPVELCYTSAGKAMQLSLQMIPTEWRNPQWIGSVSLREVLQYYATEITRAKDPNYWVRALADKAASFLHGGGAFVFVDDVRFPNEKAFVDRTGVCMRLNPYNGWKPGPNAGHLSETALDDAEFSQVLYPYFGELEVLARDLFHKLCGPLA